MCHALSTMWWHAGHLSVSACLMRYMWRRVGRWSWANLMINIWVLLSRVNSALLGTVQLIDRNVGSVQLLRVMRWVQMFGPLAARRSW
jgi:hypothetical protein